MVFRFRFRLVLGLTLCELIGGKPMIPMLSGDGRMRKWDALRSL